MKSPEKLVIVPGHASFKQEVDGNRLPDDIFADDPWVLQSFQRGEPPFYGEHMKAGVDILEEERGGALLVPSGGFTRAESGDKWSEAGSYVAAAIHEQWIAGAETQPSGIALDEFARDSLQNVIGGIYSFREATGEFPKQIIIPGWSFKEERFKLHAEALGIPLGRVAYIGVNNPTEADLVGAEKGEAKAVAAFRADPLGEGPELSAKRAERDPLNHGNPYHKMPKIQM